jgi:2-oxoglutarate ferredoxin oxidoreductase subunit delta
MARGTVVVDVDRCKGCELCTAVCVPKLLHLSPDHFNARGYRAVELVDPQGKCTGCTLCAMVCPDVVLTVLRLEPQRTAQVVE